jgi:cysteinyl-tRNA synthetase
VLGDGEATLGAPFEIHGGGSDLIFPHHENEAAQTLAARGHPLADVWMHNGMLEMRDAKMSKSVGNIRGLAEVLDDAGRDTLIWFFCEGHYRQPLAFTPEKLQDAARRVERIRDAGRRFLPGPSPAALAPHREAFFSALADDYNTPRALAALAAWLRDANRGGDQVGGDDLRDMLGVLGLANLLEAGAGAPGDVVELARRRAAARARRDFGEADRLREELRSLGWEIRDGSGGPELVPVGP